MKNQCKVLFFTLTISFLFTLSACDPTNLFSFQSTPPTSENIHVSPEELDVSLGRKGLIDSLGKWNYYAARKTVADYGKVPTAHNFLKTPSLAIPTTNVGYDVVDSVGNEGFEESVNPELPEDSLWFDTEEKEENRPQDTEDVRYYALYDWGTFTVERTVYFQIELTDETAFLGSRLGVGTVEVAVALGDYHDDLNMITFRNGDTFYSCMYHGYYGINENTGADKYAFAAYRYIDGFYYVKNLNYEHYEFHLEIGKGDAVFYCQYRHTADEDEQVRVIENTTYCIDQTVTYTIEELEAYFNGEINDEPEANDNIL